MKFLWKYNIFDISYLVETSSTFVLDIMSKWKLFSKKTSSIFQRLFCQIAIKHCYFDKYIFLKFYLVNMAHGASSCNLSKYKIQIKNAIHMKTPNMLLKMKTQATEWNNLFVAPLLKLHLRIIAVQDTQISPLD